MLYAFYVIYLNLKCDVCVRVCVRARDSIDLYIYIFSRVLIQIYLLLCSQYLLGI